MRSSLLLALGIAGCGPAGSTAEMRDLRTRLEAAEHARADLTQRVDDLDNRLFLLTDQVESQKVALGRRGGAPSLPVITLHPSPSRPVADELAESEQRIHYGYPSDERPAGQKLYESSPAAAPEDTVIAEERPLPMERKPPAQARRKLLRLEGHSVDGAPEAAVEGEAPGAATTKMANLGVVKLPDRGVPLAHAHDAPPAELSAPPGEPFALYREGQADLAAHKHAEAESVFRSFVKRYPRHDLADNAQYWLGETYYDRKDYTSAAPEFQSVVVRWPSGNKAPDALLKLGYCLIALGETQKGRDVLNQVAEHYPRTDAARLAERRLIELPRTEGPK